MKQKARHLINLLLGTLLGWLGFSSCEYIGGGLTMYGEPHADFKAAGKVTDKDGKAIEGIRVAIQRHRHYENTPGVIYDQNDWYENDTLYTNENGLYELRRSIFSKPDDVTLVFEDIDGEEHGGSFVSQTASPEIKQTKKGDKSWYTGAFAVEADVTLEKK